MTCKTTTINDVRKMLKKRGNVTMLKTNATLGGSPLYKLSDGRLMTLAALKSACLYGEL